MRATGSVNVRLLLVGLRCDAADAGARAAARTAAVGFCCTHGIPVNATVLVSSATGEGIPDLRRAAALCMHSYLVQQWPPRGAVGFV